MRNLLAIIFLVRLFLWTLVSDPSAAAFAAVVYCSCNSSENCVCTSTVACRRVESVAYSIFSYVLLVVFDDGWHFVIPSDREDLASEIQ